MRSPDAPLPNYQDVLNARSRVRQLAVHTPLLHAPKLSKLAGTRVSLKLENLQVTGAFKILLDEPPPRVTPPLKLRVEHAEGLEPAQIATLAREIEEEIHVRLKVRPSIEMVPPLSIDRATYKTKFIEKLYEK